MEDAFQAIVPLGWDAAWQQQFDALGDATLVPARVAVEDKHQYVIFAASGEFPAEVPGKFLHRVASPADLPKVGDWVAVAPVPNENKAIIQHILPRRTRLARKVVGREVEAQVLATNVDCAFVVQAMDQSFNPRRLERFLVMVHEGGAESTVVLNKLDLCNEVEKLTEAAQGAAGKSPVVTVSARTGKGMKELRKLIRAGRTVVFIGSSGVGKSSLINRLYGEEIQATLEVREADAKGRHATSWRELIVLPAGGLVIDTPGMREFHMWMADEGIHEAFPDVEQLGVGCHFRNCSHTVEKRCAVLAAVEAGTLAKERFESFQKLKRELDFMATERQKHTYLARKRDKAAQRSYNQFKRHKAGLED